MISSSLRNHIAVYSETSTVNATNERERKYSAAFYDWAAITFNSGDRIETLGAEMVGKVNKMKVRYRLNTYTEDHVIEWRGDYYHINSIDTDDRRTYLYMTVTRAMPGTITILTDQLPT